eukprot:CAMPEP_0196579038 /NCGR_PEP_ID=MMETSP1081-20130531/16293_1 /TAXON_ID=36882 /ORGANISM="Pyramimonas amylifera, Strain CCMP720" /LENGTH=79 /DNA_ID=CAMNT_0041898471 /DNA_START=153 /DNA_END=392 /DNA_ORIENTATION=+
MPVGPVAGYAVGPHMVGYPMGMPPQQGLPPGVMVGPGMSHPASRQRGPMLHTPTHMPMVPNPNAVVVEDNRNPPTPPHN